MCMREAQAMAKRRQSGISLLELVLFIVIVSVAIVGLLVVMNNATRSSADPLPRKQALALGEALLEEIQSMPYTRCDPDDANAEAATTDAQCATTVDAIGPETISGVQENRYGGGNTVAVNAFFDGVTDYHGFSMAAGTNKLDISGQVISADLDRYAVSVSLSSIALSDIAVASGDAILIRVTVTDPQNQSITVEGVRTRYAPNALP